MIWIRAVDREQDADPVQDLLQPRSSHEGAGRRHEPRSVAEAIPVEQQPGALSVGRGGPAAAVCAEGVPICADESHRPIAAHVGVPEEGTSGGPVGAHRSREKGVAHPDVKVGEGAQCTAVVVGH